MPITFTKPPRTVSPKSCHPSFEAYSEDAAAAEMKAIPDPCPQDTVNVSGFSALKRLVIDYGDLRQRIRAAREKD